MSIPTAAELRAKTEAAKNETARRSHEYGMGVAKRAIQQARKDGMERVSVLPLPDSVVNALRHAGYKVSDRNPARGMGDADTVDISWGPA